MPLQGARMGTSSHRNVPRILRFQRSVNSACIELALMIFDRYLYSPEICWKVGHDKKKRNAAKPRTY
jgi:hypothetical protein